MADYDPANRAMQGAAPGKTHPGLVLFPLVTDHCADSATLQSERTTFSPLSPCTQGRGVGGEGARGHTANGVFSPLTPDPSPPEYRGRGEKLVLRSSQ